MSSNTKCRKASGTSHADTEVGRESERDRVGVRLNPWVKVLVEVIVLGRDKYSAGMQHNVRDNAQKSLCDASKAREPDAESGCVMWPSCCMRRWRFICYLRIAGGSGTESLGLARFVSARLQPTIGRGSLHQGRSSGIFVAAVICDALRLDRSRHSGHDILSVDSMEGGKKSQRYHGRAQEVHRSGQSRSSGRVACAKA